MFLILGRKIWIAFSDSQRFSRWKNREN